MIDRSVTLALEEFEGSMKAAGRQVSVTLTSLQKAAAVVGPKKGRMALAGKAALLKGLTGSGGSGGADQAAPSSGGLPSSPVHANG